MGAGIFSGVHQLGAEVALDVELDLAAAHRVEGHQIRDVLDQGVAAVGAGVDG